MRKCFFFADFFPFELKQMLNLSILFIEFSKVTAIMFFFLTEYDFTFSFVKIMNRQITLSFSLLDEIKTEVFTNVTLS